MELSHEDKAYIRDLRKFTNLINSIKEQESIEDYVHYLVDNNRDAFSKFEIEINKHDFKFKDSQSFANHLFLGLIELIVEGKIIVKE
jgi:hypothetical protein